MTRRATIGLGETRKRGTQKSNCKLAIRIRNALRRRRGISEKRMFGGTCFYVNGNMIGGATGNEKLVIRVGPGRYEEALNEPHARLMDFTKRSMRGYVYDDPPGYSTDAALRTWLGKGVAYARSLPPKDRKK